MREFDDSLPQQLLKARDAAMRFFRPVLHDNDLTEQQWRIMRALWAYEQLEARQLIEYCCLHGSSLSGILNRLQNKGLIERSLSQQDQRCRKIKMTGHGKQLFIKLNKEIDRCHNQFVSKYGQENLNTLMGMLKAIQNTPELAAHNHLFAEVNDPDTTKKTE